ncbi:hypothetical protein [Lacinutrix algicola]|uniref:hypothetical protein n=1 Tax=Lacinutrix algicola TaxID=342954 RepID=UPI0006E2FEBC|nr:hypothetical protein [Lacinutrix algicola]
MELYNRIIEMIDANLILCLIPIILTLILVKLIFKNRFETKKALNLMRWTIIFYAIIAWSFYLIAMAMTEKPKEYAFINRATGPYAWAYWIMFVSALILPFSLFIKKLASKYWYVLLVAFGMKSGIYFERFIIIVTSFHRDYLTNNKNGEFVNRNVELIDLLSFGIGMIFLQGFIIAILTLGIFEIIKRKKTVHNIV